MHTATVLLVEPNRRMVRLIRFIIESNFAAQVIAVDDPDQLWQTLAHTKSDLVIVDVTPQQYHASDLATRLKENSATAEIPLVALGIAPDQAEAMHASGFNGSVPFPFSVKELVAGVRNFLHPRP